ncbi:amidase [Aureibacillus halotolerans]|uniref:Amidase n=1 Tax=Aureibacillus halotolerans TaxID=1508390 RepID=A0A4R6U446_9BACI|nr:amidase [Aureibacillus halotolerans]TDQ40861.1 amidase [Aureibacillus halotolerans]
MIVVIELNERDYVQADATQLAKWIRDKEVSSLELLEASIRQLEKVNPDLNAVVHDRRGRALAEARLHEDSAEGLFAGVPMLLKNLSHRLEGEKITSGARLFRDNVASKHSYFVKECQQAGFQMLGHTNTPEFGLKNITEPELYGPSRNPWNHAYSPGGSSGGAAAAVAGGIVPLAGASDGGGSIRIPASFTGLFGLKPTRGRTPVGPGIGRQWQGAAVDFVLTKSVRDSAAMLDVLQTEQLSAAFLTPRFPDKYREVIEKPLQAKWNIAFCLESPVGTPVSDEAQAAVKKMVRWMEEEGHAVEEVAPPIDGVDLMRQYYIMNCGEMDALLTGIEHRLGRALTEDDTEFEAWMLRAAGKHVLAADYAMSLASWDNAAEKMDMFHERYDFYITPATASAAPLVGELSWNVEDQERYRDRMRQGARIDKLELVYDMFLPSLTYTPFTQLANLTGQPAVSLPLHQTVEGLPIGVQVMSRKGQEHLLLQLAYQLEQTTLWQGMKGNPHMN